MLKKDIKIDAVYIFPISEDANSPGIIFSLIKHFIKDLSFENPQDVNNNAKNNNDNDINVNMNVIFESYDNNFFSLLLKYSYECSSKKNHEKLCHLELDYFGFFKVSKKNSYDQKSLTENGLNLIFPSAKEIVEYITKKGGSFPITLNDIDFKLIEG